MTLKVIAYARNGHTDKFGIPRQSREESPILTRIVFEPEYNVAEALRGIEGFSHLWLLWGFSEVQCDQVPSTKEWRPTVRPPRLGGNKRMGVFATRSPFRPNPIGLSSVRLIKVQRDEVQSTKDGRMELIVSGADVLDGTPIYDIKPYLSFSDCHPGAKNGFAEDAKDHHLEVVWPNEEEIHTSERGLTEAEIPEKSLGLPGSIQEAITYILAQDPRPGYQDDPEREYKMDYDGWRVTFNVDGQIARVKRVEQVC